MPPFTHVIKGESLPTAWADPEHTGPPPHNPRTSEDVARDITEVHKQAIERNGKFLNAYVSNPNNGNGDTIFIVIDYPEQD